MTASLLTFVDASLIPTVSAQPFLIVLPSHAPGPPARYPIFFRQRLLVEMFQFMAFPKGIGRTTPSNQACSFVERMLFWQFSKLALIINNLRSTTRHDDSGTIAKLKLDEVIQDFAELANAFE